MKLKAEKSKSQLRQEAYTVLGVTPEQVEQSPKIEHLFRGFGGQVKVLEFLEGSEEPDARAVVNLRSQLTVKHAAEVPFEAYCIAAGVPVKKMFGIVAAEIHDQSNKSAQLLANVARPAVVQATIDSALTMLGQKDREMLHKAAGFVPVPKGQQTTVNIDNRSQVQNVAVLPPPETGIRRLNDRFNAHMAEQIKALPPPEDVQDGDADEGDDEE